MSFIRPWILLWMGLGLAGCAQAVGDSGEAGFESNYEDFTQALEYENIDSFDSSPESVLQAADLHERFIVKFKDQVPSTFTLPEDVNVKNHWRVKSVTVRVQSISEDMVSVDLKGMQNRHETLQELLDRPDIEYIEPDYILTSDALSRDPGASRQWAHQKVQTTAAWNAARSAREVVVAIIDGGVDIDHPDLKANIWRNPGERRSGRDDDRNGFVDDVNGWNFVNNNSNPKPSVKSDDHGTHIAGTIAAVSGNGIGIAGHGHNIKIMPLKYLSGKQGYTSNAIRAIKYAIKNNAKVINASWGSFQSKNALRDAIQEAERAGVVFVTAAGNYGTNVDKKPYYPANYSFNNVISVAATGKSDTLGSFSNYGKRVHIGAPGVNIYSTINSGANCSSIKVTSYCSKSGTSMAAPLVSAVAAMMLGENPNLTPSQVRSLMISSADRYSSLNNRVQNGGRINALKAVQAAQRAR